MATIKYLLQSKSAYSQIYLRLSLGRAKGLERSQKPKFISYKRKTGLLINHKEWSTTTGLPLQNNPKNKNLTSDLRKLNNYILDQLNNANSKGVEVNGNWLYQHIELFFDRMTIKDKSDSVVDSIQRIVDTAHTRENGKGGIGLGKCRINSYNRLSELFKEFQGLKNYTIPQLGKIEFESFKTWLLDKKGYSPTYALKKLADLKTVCKDASNNGIKTSLELGGIKTKQVSAYDDDMDVITLTPHEIEKIEKAELDNDALVNARKWLILACYTGQRGQALTERIKEENFHNYGQDLVIRIQQKKGNKSITIPVLPKVREIYENEMPYKVSMAKLNKHFKKIGQIAELNEMVMGRITEVDDKGDIRGVKKMRQKWKYISTHIGRRTFASNHYGKMPTPVIMRVTGHSKESTFLTYINKSDEAHVDEFLDYYKNKELKEQKEPQLNIVKTASNQ